MSGFTFDTSPREWRVKITDHYGILHVAVTDGRLDCGYGWYPKSERQLRRAVAKAQRLAKRENQSVAKSIYLKEIADREGLA